MTNIENNMKVEINIIILIILQVFAQSCISSYSIKSIVNKSDTDIYISYNVIPKKKIDLLNPLILKNPKIYHYQEDYSEELFIDSLNKIRRILNPGKTIRDLRNSKKYEPDSGNVYVILRPGDLLIYSYQQFFGGAGYFYFIYDSMKEADFKINNTQNGELLHGPEVLIERLYGKSKYSDVYFYKGQK